LVEKNETSTVFQLFEWHLSWWNVYGNDNLLALLAFEGKELIGIAPLMKINYGLTRNMIQFIGEGRSDYNDFIIPVHKKKIISLFLDYLKKIDSKWNVLHLNNIPESSTSNTVLQSLCDEQSIKYLERRKVSCSYIDLSDTQHLNKILNKKTLKRRYRHFKNNGKLNFRHIVDVDNALIDLKVYFKQHIERLNINKQKSLFLEKKNQQFYKELLLNLLNMKCLKFSKLEYNNIPLAYHFGFEYNDKYIWYKPAFNVNYKKYSPGNVLLKYLIEYTIENGLEEFDFTIGNEKFKNKYANGFKQNKQIEIYNNKYYYKYELLKLKLNWIHN
jgi:CelD/BcsL family acetyltransferase involved in cellulose biosynthesis